MIAEENPKTLFFIWQTFREALAKNHEGEKLDTAFQVKTKGGKIVTYQTLDEMAKDGELASP